MQTFSLISPENTYALGQKLGLAIGIFFKTHNKLPIDALLLQGPLGSGKTNLTCAIVQNLPQGQDAEVSSPSFTLCNTYATKPAVLHIDLYRCEHNIPHEFWEALDLPNNLIIAEWAEYLPSTALPQNFLDIFFKICDEGRLITLTAHGAQAKAFLQQANL